MILKGLSVVGGVKDDGTAPARAVPQAGDETGDDVVVEREAVAVPAQAVIRRMGGEAGNLPVGHVRVRVVDDHERWRSFGLN